MRVWIEMYEIRHSSPPPGVTLHVRVWIEICSDGSGSRYVKVTLHVRVWIEMSKYLEIPKADPRSPST